MQKRMAKTRIALDGPSALALYRNRSQARSQYQPWYSANLHVAAAASPELSEEWSLDDEDIWLSDEDVAATLAESHIFGKATEVNRHTEDDPSDLVVLERTRISSFRSCVSCSRDLKKMPLVKLGIDVPTEDSPLYLVVQSSAERRRVKNVRARAFSDALPPGAFRRLGEQVLVPTPEFTFLLLARYLSVTELIMVGLELCGYYRLLGTSTSVLLDSTRTLYSQPSLTNVAKIKSFLDKCTGLPGLAKAERALRHVADGSASPMETALFMLFCLPAMLGGYAIEHPVLNQKRVLGKHAGRLVLSPYLIPDLYWPMLRLDVEYDSEAFHASPESLKRGAQRTLALRVMDVDVVSLTKEVVRDVDAFDSVARLLCKRLERRPPSTTDKYCARRLELRELVLSA